MQDVENKIIISDDILPLIETIITPQIAACHCAIHPASIATIPANTSRTGIKEACYFMENRT